MEVGLSCEEEGKMRSVIQRCLIYLIRNISMPLLLKSEDVIVTAIN